jgi:sugar lactone lactonase YvrE
MSGTTARRLDVAVVCAVDARDTTGESPVWSVTEQALYWVDIHGPAIRRWHPATGALRSWPMPDAVGSIGLHAKGGLVVALRTGFLLFDPESAALTLLVHLEPHLPTNRLNDGKVAPDGSFWAGTMDDRADKEATGSLYRLGSDGSCSRMATGFKVSNGLAWSPDGRTMYHSDSRAARIWRYAHEPGTGRLGPRQEHVVMRPEWGRPDGGAVDADGCYWGCGIDAGRINRFSPAGDLITWIELPVTHPTMPCFGGPDLRTMYVTSLRGHLSNEQLALTPHAGGLFAFTLDVCGTPVAEFAG